MTDYGHDLLFGAFIPPTAGDAERVVRLSVLCEQLGLDVVSFQDHPYQPSFLDTWTLLSYVGARTSRVRLVPNVANLPLRPPAVLARSAASLDLLTGGRVELGLGAGAFFDGVAAMGGPRLAPPAAVDALAEGIDVIRGVWGTGRMVRVEGEHYHVVGARPGPPTPHPIGIWLGAYKPRMLSLTGRVADGWIPTLGYASPADLPAMTTTIDAAAADAGRDPGEVRRLFNVSGSFAPTSSGYLQGPVQQWIEELTELALDVGISGFVLASGVESIAELRRFADEVAPGVRELVAAERQHPRPPAADARDSIEIGPPSDTVAVAAAVETERLVEEQEPISEAGRRGQETLLAVHQHLRDELVRLADIVEQVAAGELSIAGARSHVAQTTMRQNYWTLGAFCASYCRVVSVHHTIEDERMFPDIERGDASLAPVIARLSEEHEVIAGLLSEVDEALVVTVGEPARLDDARAAVRRLGDQLLRHLAYEEEQLLPAIGRLGLEV